MSFFNDPENAGLALIVVGILTIILNLALIVLGVLDDPIDWKAIVAAIGSIIGGFLYFKYGSKVRGGAISQKIDILGEFVKVVAIVEIITGIFLLPGSVGSGILAIILGLIILWASKKISDGKVGTIDKIIWIILLIVFVLSLLGGIFSLLVFPVGTISGICYIIISLFMIFLLIDGDVKKQMGM